MFSNRKSIIVHLDQDCANYLLGVLPKFMSCLKTCKAAHLKFNVHCFESLHISRQRIVYCWLTKQSIAVDAFRFWLHFIENFGMSHNLKVSTLIAFDSKHTPPPIILKKWAKTTIKVQGDEKAFKTQRSMCACIYKSINTICYPILVRVRTGVLPKTIWDWNTPKPLFFARVHKVK